MESRQIRGKFLEFFQSKGHKIVPSAPIVVQNDPTLMFTNAGMNQFKDFFLGNKSAEQKRIVDTQKCLRVSGKHNDLEEVGLDTYHHTMFEMLGNWSFGDYFKKEAIEWSWELLTDVYKLPKDRLYVTVFEGDHAEKLEKDNDAFNFWSTLINADRILDGNKKDNFWEMGDTGPCGPCSEIHIDLRSEDEIRKIPGSTLVNQDHPEVIEIWNLVFIQFNRKSDGSLENLPEKHVDTGMGFERLAMAIQGKKSNYDTDVFQPLISYLAQKANVEYGVNEKNDIALRVISDHVRAISFSIADGQMPGNAKAGYVIRRILRRAVRYGYTFLSFREPVIYQLVPILAKQFEGVFPELSSQKEFVSKVIKEEESSFLRTLENGLRRFDSLKNQVKGKVISGKDAFEMYDTYGFPFDLTSLIARENGLSVDEKEFSNEMEKQKNRSKNAAQQDTGDWQVIVESAKLPEFVGYENNTYRSRILRTRKVTQKKGEYYQIVFDKTPFYAESGGQVGDTGTLSNGEETIRVFDTKKENDLIVHFVKKLPENLSTEFELVVDQEKRQYTQNNHSATHLLHAALRKVLGEHVKQKGSLVNDQVLRFDFEHFSRMTEEEILEVEKIVNEKIRENILLGEKRNVPIDEAMQMGAMALFGEKYGDFVRVITFDKEFSVELCGGTHVPSTGHIGFFKIISEASSSAGVRRIEAITAKTAEDYVNQKINKLSEIDDLLKNPKDTIKAIHSLIDERSALLKKIEEFNLQKAKSLKKDVMDSLEQVGEINFSTFQGEFPGSDILKNISFELKNEVSNLVLIVGANIDNKPIISIMISDSLTRKYDLNAGQMVREISKEIKGGGGGQAFYATAGGKDISGLEKALDLGKKIVFEKIQAPA